MRKKLNTSTKDWEDSSEIPFYICTHKNEAKDYDRLIRSHWLIENSNHYVRDHTLKEDSSRIRRNPINFVILRPFVTTQVEIAG